MDAPNLKRRIQKDVERLLRTIFTAIEIYLRAIDLPEVESNNPGMAILHTTIQILKASTSPLLCFLGFEACFFHQTSLLPVPYHPYDEERIRDAAVHVTVRTLAPVHTMAAKRYYEK
jgi:hypothetical protein